MGEWGGDDRVVSRDGIFYFCLVNLRDGDRLREGGCKVSEFSKLVVFGVVGEGTGLPFFYAAFARLAPCSFRSEDVVT